MNYSSYEFRSKKYIYFLTLHSNLGALVGGMFIVALNACNLEDFAAVNDDASEENLEAAILASAIPLGAIFGAWMSSYLAAQNGRRKTLIIADILGIIGSLISLSSSLTIMTIGRLICGVVVGMNWTVIPLYVREISPPDLSGKSGAFFRVMFCAGMVFTFVMSYILSPSNTSHNYWQVILLSPIVFCSARIIIFIFSVQMDTPRFYMAQGDEDNALMAFSLIYKQEQIDSIYKRENKFEDVQGFRDIFRANYKKQFSVVFLLIFVDEFMGTSALSFYSSFIFLDIANAAPGDKMHFSTVRGFNLIFTSVRFLATIVGTLLVDKLGRRPMIIYGTLFTTLVGGLLTTVGFLDRMTEEKILIVAFTAVQTLSLNLVIPIYAAELLPTFGIGLQVIFQMLCTLIVTSAFPFLMDVSYGFLFFSIVGLCSFIPIFKTVKETKGKTLNEIYKLFENDAGLLDEEVVDDLYSPTKSWRY